MIKCLDSSLKLEEATEGFLNGERKDQIYISERLFLHQARRKVKWAKQEAKISGRRLVEESKRSGWL